VQQQFGMILGVEKSGQLNALATLNIRGERSVTCRGDFDRHPSLGPLPPAAPPICEYFRHFPDALERAAELDAMYGRNPDLDKMPMYGVVFSFKDSFDTKDMRSTGGGDAAYDIDFPARDHILVEQLRNKGAIIFAKAVNTEYNGRAGDPGGRHTPDTVLPSTLGYQRATWGGNPANPYDTRRAASLGSSSGSGVSVSANLVMASLGEETRASCRGPSNPPSLRTSAGVNRALQTAIPWGEASEMVKRSAIQSSFESLGPEMVMKCLIARPTNLSSGQNGISMGFRSGDYCGR
jgi:hypothetical protein